MTETTPENGEASRFYIESAASFQERRPRVLKRGPTFAVFDPRGDIVAVRGSPDGIYHRDTRYLSRLELRLNDAPLLLLSSNVQEDNVVLTVDLTNPDPGEGQRMCCAASGSILIAGDICQTIAATSGCSCTISTLCRISSA